MDISTTNVIIGCGLSSAGGIVIFSLGVITSYIRSIKNDMKELLKYTIEHKAKIEQQEKQIEDIYDKIYKLKIQ